MKSYIQIREKAVLLRKNGASYSEIQKETGASLAVLSNWLSKIPLAASQKEELNKRVIARMARGRLNARVSKKAKRVYLEKVIYDSSEKDFERLMEDKLFVIGLSLYLAKGSKKGGQVRFMSSSPEMIEIMKKWCERYLDNKCKVKQSIHHQTLYMGGVEKYRRVLAWQKLLIQYYNNVLKIE